MSKIFVDESHKERTLLDNYQSLKTLLGKYGEIVVRIKKPLTAAVLRRKDLLVIGGPEHPWVFGRGEDQWDKTEISTIKRFIARGGALLFMGDGMGSAENMSAVTSSFSITFSEDLVGDVTISRKSLASHSITEEVHELFLGSVLGMGGRYLKVDEPAVVLAEHNERPVLAYNEYENGRVVVLSSLSAFSNKCLEKGDNRLLLKNIIDHLLIPHRIIELSPAVKTAKQRVEAKSSKQELALRILRDVPESQAFRFFTDVGQYTGESASSLADFHEKITKVPLKSIEFHFQREDFEKWIKGTFGDTYCVDKMKTIDRSTSGEPLRKSIQQILKRRLNKLKKEAVVKEKKKIVKPIKKKSVVEAVSIMETKEPIPKADHEPLPIVKPPTVELAHTPLKREVWFNLFGDESTKIEFDFTTHIQQFATGLPALSWKEDTLKYVRSLRKPDVDQWIFDLPFTQPEPWSSTNYLRRLLYHLIYGQISYYINAQMKETRGGFYGLAWSAANMDQQGFVDHHPITFASEQFLGRWWPMAIDTGLGIVAGGVYHTNHRLLLHSESAWIKHDEKKELQLPFLSYWSKVDFSILLQALGVEGIPLLIEENRGILPNSLAPQMWFEPIDDWQKDITLRVEYISSWEMDLILIEGHQRGDGVKAPSQDQIWAFFGYNITKMDNQREFVAMMPYFIVRNNPQNKKNIQDDFKIFKANTTTIDALDLIAFTKVARDNELLYNADLFNKPVSLQNAPQLI